MKFLVEIEVPHYRSVLVEADDHDDAIDKARLGEGEVQSQDRGPEVVWTVQEVKP